jgi:beta-phosphoglucomutase family hydrolase
VKQTWNCATDFIWLHYPRKRKRAGVSAGSSLFPVPQPVSNFLRIATISTKFIGYLLKGRGTLPEVKSLSSGNINGIRALIFDMDGVIVDSEPLHLIAYQQILARFEIPYTAQDNREFLGKKDIIIADVLINRHGLPHTPHSFVESKENILFDLIKNQGLERPGLRHILDTAIELKLPMAVASSATMPTIQLVVDTLKIRHYFKTLTSGDEVAHGKPAPDVFLLAAQRLGVEPSACLVIEDTLNGVLAAKAAGMQCVAIPCETTMHQDHSLADQRLTRLDEIDLHQICQRVGV